MTTSKVYDLEKIYKLLFISGILLKKLFKFRCYDLKCYNKSYRFFISLLSTKKNILIIFKI